MVAAPACQFVLAKSEARLLVAQRQSCKIGSPALQREEIRLASVHGPGCGHSHVLPRPPPGFVNPQRPGVTERGELLLLLLHMAGRKVIVVFGATGAQGGSVARALLADGTFLVRALTRRPQQKAAQELKALGAEVVEADLDDARSLEAALRGTDGTFLVTDFWAHLSQEQEEAQGKRVADLAQQLALSHVVYSGLENVKRLTGGRLAVPHFDGKGRVEEYFQARGVPVTCLRLPNFFENFLTVFRPRLAPDGDGYELAIPMGDVPLDGMAVADLGPVVAALMKEPEKYVGQTIGLSTGKLTVAEYAALMSKYTGKSIKDAQMSIEAYQQLGFPGVEELADMFRFYHMKPERDVALTRKLNPVARTFEEWIAEQRAAFEDL